MGRYRQFARSKPGHNILPISWDLRANDARTAAEIAAKRRTRRRCCEPSWAYPAANGSSPSSRGVIGLRDQTCRTPYCDAPIRHRDNAQPHSRGGPTSAENGLGKCERCNYAKESPGWRVTAGSDENGTHTAEFVTPTRHRYRSAAPPAPGPIHVHVSEVEGQDRRRLGRPICRVGLGATRDNVPLDLRHAGPSGEAVDLEMAQLRAWNKAISTTCDCLSERIRSALQAPQPSRQE